MATESQPIEDIVILSHQEDLVKGIKKHYENAEALARVIKLDEKGNFLDEDTEKAMGNEREKEYAIASAMAEVLDARCPNCLDSYTKQGRELDAGEIVRGECWKCKASVVIKEA